MARPRHGILEQTGQERCMELKAGELQTMVYVLSLIFIWKRKRKLIQKKRRRLLRMKGTYKYTEALLERFDNHICLSQSEESKFM